MYLYGPLAWRLPYRMYLGTEGGDLSLALEVVLQPGDKTLTEADLSALSDKVVAVASKLGAKLRA